MDVYDRKIGRLRVTVNANGARIQDYGQGATIECATGWNESCPVHHNLVSVEELRDLRYLLDRAIAAAETR